MSGVQFNISVATGGSNAAMDGVVSGLHNITTQLNTLNQNFIGFSQKATSGFTEIQAAANHTGSSLKKMGENAFHLNNIHQAISGVASDFDAAVQPGIDFNDQMKDLQAITGVSEDALKKISVSARDNAKSFGIDASQGVESYKLILSQLAPEIAKVPEALQGMGKNAAILSKQMGGDVSAATQVLTTAMNQYGVSLDNPMQATKTMTAMMNIMAAGAREGSAELPQIKSALEASGMMAKTANVSFLELNSAIQVLDKAGKKGAEGGVAIRNVLAELSQGNMMPRKQLEMLHAAGINTDALADKSKSFSERLSILKPLMNDTAAMTLLFGKENVAAGIALVKGTGEMDRYTSVMKDTNTATEMADIKMGSFKEKMARANATMKDWGISLFNATEGFIPFVKFGMGGLQVMANMGQAASLVSGIMNSSFITSIKSGTIFTNIFTGAQAALNFVMSMNPIALVVIGIAALVAGLVLAYNKSETFRAVISGLISVGKVLMDVFLGVGKVLMGAFTLDLGMIKAGATQAATAVAEIAQGGIAKAFSKGFDQSMAASKTAADADKAKAANEAATKTAAEAAMKNMQVAGITFQGEANKESALKEGYNPHDRKKHGKEHGSKELASNISSGGSRPTTINLTIHKLQDQIVLHTTNLQTGAKEAGKQIVEEILMALNSVNAKAAT